MNLQGFYSRHGLWVVFCNQQGIGYNLLLVGIPPYFFGTRPGRQPAYTSFILLNARHTIDALLEQLFCSPIKFDIKVSFHKIDSTAPG
jgi:hypothetical protein